MNYATWTPGPKLTPKAREQAFARYVHRCTVENFQRHPSIAQVMRKGGYRLRVLTDAEWLANTQFPTRADGELDNRVKHCWHTHPDTSKASS
jgi:hypothetical protein